MPRYFFHFTDGQRVFGDSEGREFSGLREARAHATRQVRDLKAAMCAPHIQDLSGWSMLVADTSGRTVFVIGFDLRPESSAPLTPAPRPPSAPGR